MKRLLLASAVVLALAGCGHSRSGIRYIDGVKSVCTWRDPAIGTDRDLICYPVVAASEPVTAP